MSQAINSENDNRIFERFYSRFPAKVKDSNEEFGEKVVLCDASAMGAKIASIHRFFINDILSLEVKLPDAMPPMELKGQVVWSKRYEENSWEAGIKFPKIRLMRLQRLYKFVHLSSRS